MKISSLDHLYVHVPFCDGKCSYCAFYSEIYSPERADRYLDSLATEFDIFLGENDKPAPKTVYLGGGTSSTLNAPQLARLCETLQSRISVENLQEWSIEASPGSLSSDKLDVVRKAGVNRLSMGAQSFDDEVLERMGRRHTAADVESTIHAVREAGINNVGLDLIACLPGVYDETWKAAVQKTLELKPTHVSVYALTIEKGSQLHRLVRSGDVIVPDDDLQSRTLDMAEKLLEDSGYLHYEISNYALPGLQCLHNLSCWRGEDYLGLGPAASSRAGLNRWTNRPNIDRYVDALSSGDSPPRELDELSPESDATERLIFNFRLSEGVNVARFGQGLQPLIDHWNQTLSSLVDMRLVETKDNIWVLTKRGRSLADFVAYELINV